MSMRSVRQDVIAPPRNIAEDSWQQITESIEHVSDLIMTSTLTAFERDMVKR